MLIMPSGIAARLRTDPIAWEEKPSRTPCAARNGCDAAQIAGGLITWASLACGKGQDRPTIAAEHGFYRCAG
jgi:hypothetical protein